jgi:hypothetical protein
MDDSDVGCRSVASECKEAIVGSEEFVSLFARFGAGEGEYNKHSDNAQGG